MANEGFLLQLRKLQSEHNASVGAYRLAEDKLTEAEHSTIDNPTDKNARLEYQRRLIAFRLLEDKRAEAYGRFCEAVIRYNEALTSQAPAAMPPSKKG